MPDKQPEWSDYSYNNSDIAKRLGIDREEVESLKAEAAKKSSEDGLAPDSTNEAVATAAELKKALAYGTAGANWETGELGFSVGVPGIIGIDYDGSGNGQVDLLKFITVKTVRIKCFYVQRFYFAGQYLFSDIQRVDSDECNKEPEPEPEPEPPDPGETPKPSPKIPPIIEPFYGLWSCTESGASVRTDWGGDPNYFAKTKYYNRTNFIRLMLHENPFYDIWQMNIKWNMYSREIWPTRSIDTGENNGGNLNYYYCEDVSALLSQGIITGIINNYYYDGNKLYNHWNEIIWSASNQRGILEYKDFTRFPLAAPRAGTAVSGNIQAVVEWRKNFKITEADEPNYTAYRMIETNQIINFYNLVPQQKINNPSLINISKGEEMNEDCCRVIKKLAKYQGLGSSVKEIKVKDNKIKEKGGNDDIFPLQIPKRWIDRKAKPEDTTEIKNMRHLLLSIGIMLDRFEELWNPAGKDSAFPLKKPEEGLWKWLPGDGGDYRYPDPNFDPKKSKQDGKIGLKNLKIETYLDLFRYFLESQIRLEMLFPIAQIQDSKISKRLIYPKAKGEIRINDMIQLQELLLLYLNKTLGDPTASVIIKDADPTKEGNQPLTVENFDLSDMLRKLIRFSVDINSDVDLANNFGKRTLYQLLSAMQVLTKNYEMIEALFEDSGMTESQEFVKLKLYADPYAGGWKAGEGFDPNRVKVENTEANIEANLEAFLQETEIDVKVSRRAQGETTDIRDLLSQIGRYAAETAAQGKIPNTPEAIQAAIDKARFELQTDSAITRADVRQAASAGRVRTKRNTKKKRR